MGDRENWGRLTPYSEALHTGQLAHEWAGLPNDVSRAAERTAAKGEHRGVIQYQR